jgi:pimeloyl-ACP methyl ester carboxylesterase
LRRAARDSRLFNTVVRYNMRGAHNSVAKRNFNLLNMLTAPEADPQDLVAVCDYVLKQLPDPPLELFLVGYSYGSTVAASALQQVPEVGPGGGGASLVCGHVSTRM